MSITDPIANYLTVVRNASSAKKESTDCPFSKLKEEISKVLKKEGFIKNFKKIDGSTQGTLRIYLKYGKGREKAPTITGIRRISKPGIRTYRSFDEIKPVFGGVGIAIISTSKGLKTDKECRAEKIGGEVICALW